jgi:hypothetical protein
MRLHDGLQDCPNCQGQGCYWCRKTGTRAQCPRCMNSEPEFITRKGDNVVCGVCDTEFERSGDVVPVDPPPKPKLTAKVPQTQFKS